MNRTAVPRLTRSSDQLTVPDHDGDQPEDQGSEQAKLRRRPILREKRPSTVGRESSGSGHAANLGHEARKGRADKCHHNPGVHDFDRVSVA